MKAIFMKAMLPVAAFVLASAGAVSTQKTETPSGKLVLAQGWQRTGAFQCTFVRDCNQIGSALCFSGSIQLFGKADDFADCIDPLTHRVMP
jgi:hypothetical protein